MYVYIYIYIYIWLYLDAEVLVLPPVLSSGSRVNIGFRVDPCWLPNFIDIHIYRYTHTYTYVYTHTCMGEPEVFKQHVRTKAEILTWLSVDTTCSQSAEAGYAVAIRRSFTYIYHRR